MGEVKFRTQLQARGPAAAVVLDDDQVAAVGEGTKRFPVVATVNGYTWRTSVTRMYSTAAQVSPASVGVRGAPAKCTRPERSLPRQRTRLSRARPGGKARPAARYPAPTPP